MFEISQVHTCNYFLQICIRVVALKKKVLLRFWGICSTWNNKSPFSVQIVFLWAAGALTSSRPQESLDEIQHDPCHRSEFSVKVQVVASTNIYNLLCDYQIVGIMPNKWHVSPFYQLMTWTSVTFCPPGYKLWRVLAVPPKRWNFLLPLFTFLINWHEFTAFP